MRKIKSLRTFNSVRCGASEETYFDISRGFEITLERDHFVRIVDRNGNVVYTTLFNVPSWQFEDPNERMEGVLLPTENKANLPANEPKAKGRPAKVKPE